MFVLFFISLLIMSSFSYLQCSFVEHRNYKIVYRRYASLFFLVGVDSDEVSHLVLFLNFIRHIILDICYIDNFSI